MTWIDGVILLLAALAWFGVLVWVVAARPLPRLVWAVQAACVGLAVCVLLHRASGVPWVASACAGLVAGPLISTLWQLKQGNLGWERKFLDRQQARLARRSPPKPRDD